MSSPDTRGPSVAIIMDGNGRWASARDLPVTEGHRAGGRALRRTVEAAIDLDVAELTVYAFSTENWRRSPEEVAGIMQLFCDLLDEETPELHAQGVRMRFMGSRDGLGGPILERMEHAEQLTADNERMTLVIAFNYGGRAEIVDAVHRILAAGAGAGRVTEAAISGALDLPDLAEPDLIVRTAGEQRTSNFLLWQSAYSELYFTDVLWPDFGEPELRAALASLASRERRFGGRLDAASSTSGGGATR